MIEYIQILSSFYSNLTSHSYFTLCQQVTTISFYTTCTSSIIHCSFPSPQHCLLATLTHAPCLARVPAERSSTPLLLLSSSTAAPDLTNSHAFSLLFLETCGFWIFRISRPFGRVFALPFHVSSRSSISTLKVSHFWAYWLLGSYKRQVDPARNG